MHTGVACAQRARGNAIPKTPRGVPGPVLGRIKQHFWNRSRVPPSPDAQFVAIPIRLPSAPQCPPLTPAPNVLLKWSDFLTVPAAYHRPRRRAPVACGAVDRDAEQKTDSKCNHVPQEIVDLQHEPEQYQRGGNGEAEEIKWDCSCRGAVASGAAHKTECSM